MAKKVENKPTTSKDEQPSKTWLILTILGIVGMVGGVACALVAFLLPEKEVEEIEFPTVPSKQEEEKFYSNLTGLEVASEAEKTAPTFCVQTPNGTDGARPQAGLNTAGVIFEAIAEAGITRFAAIYQNPTSAVIGPIRSLRIYYLQWDTPFDCTIVHAGGADDALAAVRNGGYKDLSESRLYMYRGDSGLRRWNNLFTNATLLKQFATDEGYTTSNVNGFARMTPDESTKVRVDNTVAEKLVITKPALKDTHETTPAASNIMIRFGSIPTYNVKYTYNKATNSYDRGYENDNINEILVCPNEDKGQRNPEEVCSQGTLSPAVVIAMVVEERKAEDNYHEDITAVGEGEAYIFQNGMVIHGGWSKPTTGDQIKFNDANGNEVKLAPGQTVVEAVPTYGGIEFQ